MEKNKIKLNKKYYLIIGICLTILYLSLIFFLLLKKPTTIKKETKKIDKKYETTVEFVNRPEITIPELDKKKIVVTKEIKTDIPFQDGDVNRGENLYNVYFDNGDSLICESIKNGNGNNVIFEKIKSCSSCGEDYYTNRVITSWSNIYKITHITRKKE